jgi:WD40 repeat protein
VAGCAGSGVVVRFYVILTTWEGYAVRTFAVGEDRIHSLAYSADGGALLVDVRDEPRQHPCMASECLPARELVWWDWLAGAELRRFRLRDSLYGPRGAMEGVEGAEDSRPDEAALDLSFTVRPLRVATAWEWTNKEDGVCVFDVERQQVLTLLAPYKTHTERLCLAPGGDKLAAATSNDMDGSRRFEVWDCVAEVDATEKPLSGLEASSDWRHRRWLEEQSACPNLFPGGLTAIAFEGRYLVASSAGETAIVLWDSARPPLTAGDLKPIREPRVPPLVDVEFTPSCLTFGPGSPLLAVAGAGLGVFDVEAEAWKDHGRRGPEVNAVAFTVDGALLVAGTAAGTVEVWDVASVKMVRGFDWGLGAITALACSSDGQTCAAGTASGQVIVWDRE